MEGFNKFVEGSDGQHQRGGSISGGGSRAAQVPLDESKKDFWDSFASAADQRKSAGSSIGTSAMGKGPGGGAASKKSQDEWDDW